MSIFKFQYVLTTTIEQYAFSGALYCLPEAPNLSDWKLWYSRKCCHNFFCKRHSKWKKKRTLSWNNLNFFGKSSQMINLLKRVSFEMYFENVIQTAYLLISLLAKFVQSWKSKKHKNKKCQFSSSNIF